MTIRLPDGQRVATVCRGTPEFCPEEKGGGRPNGLDQFTL